MRDDLEERVRALLRTQPPQVDAHRLLADVQAGARRRRKRRTALLAGACLVVVSGLSTTVAVQRSGHDPTRGFAVRPTPAAPTQAPTGSPRPAATERPGTGRPEDAAVGTVAVDGTPSGEAWQVLAGDCGGGMCARLIREEGEGWGTVRVFRFRHRTEAKRSPLPPVESVRVSPDGQDIWAFGQQLWSTHDGGAVWRRQLLDPGSPPERVDLAQADGRVFALQSDPVRLWMSRATEDGWREVPLEGGYSFGERVVAISGTVGVVTYSRSTDERVLLTSHDGGTTWQEASLPCRGEFGPVRTTGRSMFLACSSGPDSGLDVWRSEDGDHWRVMRRIRTATHVMVPVDDHTALVVTDTGGLLVTARGEEPVKVPLSGAETVLFGRFVSPHEGYLVLAPQQLLRTTDGGRSWSRAD